MRGPGVILGMILVLTGLATLTGAAATAQLLPAIGNGVGQTLGTVDALGNRIGDGLANGVDRTVGAVNGAVAKLADLRSARLGKLVRDNPQSLELDARGDPAVRGELIALDATPAMLQAATAAGFTIVERSEVEGLGIATARLRVPPGVSLAKAEKQLAKLAPEATIQSNPIYEPMAAATRPAATTPSTAAPGPGAAIGMIDGGVAAHATLPKTIVQRGFAEGAPVPGEHGTAVASILVGQGAVRGVSPQSRLFTADIYGRDPRGGNALAIARALGWLAGSGVRIVNISLAGPANPLLARAVDAADRRGMLMVAAVGNDGAAAPPAYPASYPQVIAVTGVDARGRALIEAGKARHLDFAAPGADLLAASAAGGIAKVRGTSFAAPFVAGRLARLSAAGPLPRSRAVALLAGEAERPKAGPASLYGRGIICAPCATR